MEMEYFVPPAEAQQWYEYWCTERMSWYQSLGMPARLSELEIPAAGIEAIVEDSMKNFNADPKREFLHHRDELLETLRACW